MAENLFSKYLKFYKEKSQEEIKKDVIKTGRELIKGFSEDAYFVYFGVLILSFADRTANREELDFVNYVNDTLKLGHEHVSPDDDVEEMNELVNGNVYDWVLEFHAAREFGDSYFKDRYHNMIKFMVACLSYKKSISEKELKFLEQIGAQNISNKGLSYDLSQKSSTNSDSSDKIYKKHDDEFDVEDMIKEKEVYKKFVKKTNAVIKEYSSLSVSEKVDKVKSLLTEYFLKSNFDDPEKSILLNMFLFVLGNSIYVTEAMADLFNELNAKYNLDAPELEESEFCMTFLQYLDDVQENVISYFVTELYYSKKYAKEYDGCTPSELFARVCVLLKMINTLDEEEINLGGLEPLFNLDMFDGV